MVKARAAAWGPPRSPLPTWRRHRSSMYEHTSSSLFLALRAKGRRRDRWLGVHRPFAAIHECYVTRCCLFVETGVAQSLEYAIVLRRASASFRESSRVCCTTIGRSDWNTLE